MEIKQEKQIEKKRWKKRLGLMLIIIGLAIAIIILQPWMGGIK